MASVVDFTMLRQSPFEGALDPIVAAAEGYASRRHKDRLQQEAEAARLKLEEESQRHMDARNRDNQEQVGRQTDRLNARDENIRMREDRKANLDEQRLQGDQTIKNYGQRNTARDQMNTAVAHNDMGRARQIAEGYAEMDPATGKVSRGYPGGFSVEEPPPVPMKPEGRPLEMGPQASPEEAQQAGKIRAEQASFDEGAGPDSQYTDQAEAERQRFQRANTGSKQMEQQGGQIVSPNGPELALYEQQLAAHDKAARNPKVTIGGVETTPDDLRQSAGRTAGADFQRVGSVLQAEYADAHQSGDPQAIASAERKVARYRMLIPMVESGQLDGAKATADILQAAAGENKRGQAQEHDATMGRYGLAKQRLANDKPASPTSERGVGVKELSAANADLNAFQRNWNVSADRNEEARMASLLKSNDKSIVQRAIVSNLSRGLAGEKGVLTDQDVNRLQGSLGGAWEDVVNWVDKKGTGQLDPVILGKLTEGINVVLAEKSRKRDQAEAAYGASFMRPTSPYQKMGLGDHLANKADEMFGPGAGARIQARLSGKPGGASAATVDPTNPDDANAPNAGRPLDEPSDDEAKLQELEQELAKRRGRK